MYEQLDAKVEIGPDRSALPTTKNNMILVKTTTGAASGHRNHDRPEADIRWTNVKGG